MKGSIMSFAMRHCGAICFRGRSGHAVVCSYREAIDLEASLLQLLAGLLVTLHNFYMLAKV